MSDKLEITVNGDAQKIESGTTVADLLLTIGEPALDGLALAINEEVTPRSTWPKRVLVAGDKVLLVRAAQGG